MNLLVFWCQWNSKFPDLAFYKITKIISERQALLIEQRIDNFGSNCLFLLTESKNSRSAIMKNHHKTITEPRALSLKWKSQLPTPTTILGPAVFYFWSQNDPKASSIVHRVKWSIADPHNFAYQPSKLNSSLFDIFRFWLDHTRLVELIMWGLVIKLEQIWRDWHKLKSFVLYFMWRWDAAPLL